MTMLFSLLEQATTLVRYGKEYAGACPWCGGTDRFHYFPDSDRYWCIDKGRNGCGRKGDAIQFLRDYHGLSFHEAKQRVRGNHAPQDARPSLDRAVAVEFKAWKSAKHGDALERLGSAQSVVELLLACQRFSLSEQEAETSGRILTEWYDQLDAIESELVRYSPNPKVDESHARQEWMKEQGEGEA